MAEQLSVPALPAALARPLTPLHHAEPYTAHRATVEEPLSADVLWARMEPYLVQGCHERWVKPVLDRVLALVLLLIALPIIALAALSLRSQIGAGGALLPQARVGRDGEVFKM